MIDSLLASPRYGEKWGRHWLDLARYGDTAGFGQDPYLLIAWRYRDYVIKSFNDDKPYDRFTKEQIAGDDLYPNDPQARSGTGFYRVGTNRDMLFKIEDVNLVEKRMDMVDTTGSVFLGLTVACARCHITNSIPSRRRIPSCTFIIRSISVDETFSGVFIFPGPIRVKRTDHV